MLVKDANIHAKELVTAPAEEGVRVVLATNQCDKEIGIALGYNMGIAHSIITTGNSCFQFNAILIT